MIMLMKRYIKINLVDDRLADMYFKRKVCYYRYSFAAWLVKR